MRKPSMEIMFSLKNLNRLSNTVTATLNSLGLMFWQALPSHNILYKHLTVDIIFSTERSMCMYLIVSFQIF